MTVWFCSDHHFDHGNLITKMKIRDFPDVGTMNAELVKRHNAKVKPTEVVYMLGDFAMNSDTAYWLGKLNGQKRLLIGNHDKKRKTHLLSGWVSVHDYLEIKLGDTFIVLCHYPMMSWNGSYEGSLMFHGHTHANTWNSPGPYMKQRVNLCVEAWNYEPVSLEEINAKRNKNLLKAPK